MKLEQIHRVYFVGIGGIGMSALARWFMHHDTPVSGYDRTATPLTEKLELEGAVIHYEDNVALISEAIKNDIDHSLIIYTPAIPVGHKELNFFKQQGFTLLKRSEVLGVISENMFTIAVAGTHGKTTTSSMVAHFLYHGGVSFTGLIGGIMSNYDSNLVISGKDPKVFVVEADEFDRSFLRLHPDIAVITSMDADHLDIYGQTEELVSSFKAFAEKLPEKGKLFYHNQLSAEVEGFDVETKISYGDKSAMIKNDIATIRDGYTNFSIGQDDRSYELTLGLPGQYNIDNATVAASVAQSVGVNVEDLKKGATTYNGVKRRFEYIMKSDQHVFIDDYAHHPTEISSFISGVRSIYPQRKLTVIFQPHLYSRTRDFMDGFAETLSEADEVILLDIYPARELPIPGVTSKVIFDKMTLEHKTICNKDNLLKELEERVFDVLCTVGAGDIDQLVEPIKKLLNRQMV